MSTDDLTARARGWAADAAPESGLAALVSELADEVDRLRGLRGRFEAQCAATRKQNDRAARAEAERDVARAALERVRAVHARRPFDYVHDLVTFGQTEFPDKCTGCREDYPCQTARALEGES